MLACCLSIATVATLAACTRTSQPANSAPTPPAATTAADHTGKTSQCTGRPSLLIMQHDRLARADEATDQYASALQERVTVATLVPKEPCYNRAAVQGLQLQNLIEAGRDAYVIGDPADAQHYWTTFLALTKSQPTAGEQAFAAGNFRAGFQWYCQRLCDPGHSTFNPVFKDADLPLALANALQAAKVGQYSLAHDILVRAPIVFPKGSIPMFPAAHYFIGAADRAMKHDPEACHAWSAAVIAWNPIPRGTFSYYDQYSVAAVRMLLRYCLSTNA